MAKRRPEIVYVWSSAPTVPVRQSAQAVGLVAGCAAAAVLITAGALAWQATRLVTGLAARRR